MRILLLGEYSNVHHTLRDAFRRAGHEVLLISDGDGWKNYPRDLDLSRKHEGPIGSLCYLMRLLRLLPRMCGFDVVQLINPDLLHLKPRWNRWFFNFLKHHNRRISVGCFGDDYYVIRRSQPDYIETCQREGRDFLDYTDFYAKGHAITNSLNEQRIRGWMKSGKAALTQYVMSKADYLVACLYEYYKIYDTPEFQGRIHYIPLPVEVSSLSKSEEELQTSAPIKVLLAVQKRRAAMKGTDQLEPLFVRLAQSFPAQISLQRVESVPFADYCRMLDEADVVVDQLYSYTPAMNALEAMNRGKVVVSGGEEAYYHFQEQHATGDARIRPIVNLRPFEQEQNYQLLCQLLMDTERVEQLKKESQQFVHLYHDADHVVSQYLALWEDVSL